MCLRQANISETVHKEQTKTEKIDNLLRLRIYVPKGYYDER
jgi:hypothetical protein